MSEKIVTLNEEVIKGEIRELVRGSVEETLNNLLEAEADKLTQARRYERSEDRQGVSQRALRPESHNDIWRSNASCAAAEGNQLRNGNH